jgi:hypothetical protein
VAPVRTGVSKFDWQWSFAIGDLSEGSLEWFDGSRGTFLPKPGVFVRVGTFRSLSVVILDVFERHAISVLARPGKIALTQIDLKADFRTLGKVHDRDCHLMRHVAHFRTTK